jgi:hypothetical protein
MAAFTCSRADGLGAGLARAEVGFAHEVRDDAQAQGDLLGVPGQPRALLDDPGDGSRSKASSCSRSTMVASIRAKAASPPSPRGMLSSKSAATLNISGKSGS